ncbi:hypothetical protein DPEC_G00223790 [Dallia pectoralis]|uniref:Uncharacterized protein n=1 Tax=Dallia pectoralis TaxID=75939 RepID=A0ACC2G073_DALPE|nr:hypothetical protein DPEC_G00223790 [Dallia pectoralis]
MSPRWTVGKLQECPDSNSKECFYRRTLDGCPAVQTVPKPAQRQPQHGGTMGVTAAILQGTIPAPLSASCAIMLSTTLNHKIAMQ